MSPTIWERFRTPSYLTNMLLCSTLLKEEILRSATDQAEDNEFSLFADAMRDKYRRDIELIRGRLFTVTLR